MPFDLPDQRVLDAARTSIRCAEIRGVADDSRVFTVIDYTRPSAEPRLWVIDRQSGDILMYTRVAHGVGSGEAVASAFSNVPGSRESSLGLFRTGETYTGEHGESLRLDGLEPGFNDQARERAIVVHSADYVTDAFVAEHGRCGRSWGCPALDPVDAPKVIDVIRGGSLVFAWYPEQHWLDASSFLHCEA